MLAAIRVIPFLAVGALLSAIPLDARAFENPFACNTVTWRMNRSCYAEVEEEYEVELANCANGPLEELRECRSGAHEARIEARFECNALRERRSDVCDLDGFQFPYNPEVDPDDHTIDITNPYAPFQVGSKWTYRAETDEGEETIEIEVLEETYTVACGVETRIVQDRAFLNGVLVEDTRDYVTQQMSTGDVIYWGEHTKELDEFGNVISLAGQWICGEDGAKQGIWVQGDPTEESSYRQELLLGEAEDVVTVVDTDAPEDVPMANNEGTLKTLDFTTLEEGAENKWYVHGVGVVMECPAPLDDDEEDGEEGEDGEEEDPFAECVKLTDYQP